ncbi:unnamed protein product [Pieris macdunnoughi]|uniref:Reverse transcriptase domain-containing protein n=1 Tax=Pieris macdunnoughi TaxID=345717 RepID=A0A821QXE2_9NEOP|nr:unnamed protein product [Pieris macdunnoughi]
MERLTLQETLQIVQLYYENGRSVKSVNRALRPIYAVDESFAEDPEESIRRRSQQLAGLSYGTTWAILRKDIGLKAYKIQSVQELTPGDLPKPHNFSFRALGKLAEDPHFGTQIVSSDEGLFGLIATDWATAGIYKSRQRLYDLYAEKSYNHNEEFILYVRNYSKLFKKVCYAAKSLNIKNKIKNSTNKTKMTWKLIDSETGRVRDRNQDIELCVDNTIIKSNEEIAIVFDKYFSDIPISTTKSLQSSPALAESLLKDNVNECKVSFSFRPISADDIARIFRTIDIKNTTDLWGISVKIISSIIDEIAPHLAIIFNNCIKSGEFPDLMKHSKVIPLFKAGSMSDPSNFRPISVLPTCSKIFEKIILNQLVSHFNVNKLLHNNQFGFTKGRSTADAGVELYRYIVKAWEESHDALGGFCDLSKAFDCVQHETLIGKLRHYGIKNTALNLLTSYLHGRTQKVEVNGKRSSGSAVDMGVPQGSILGPFLFFCLYK